MVFYDSNVISPVHTATLKPNKLLTSLLGFFFFISTTFAPRENETTLIHPTLKLS